MEVAEQILQARRRAGMTQEELARASGVRQPNIAAYENGRRKPSASMVERLMVAAMEKPSVLLARERQRIVDIAFTNRAYNVRVFGSVARHEDRYDSDIDLVVTFDPEATLFDHAGLVADLEDLLGRHVDVLSDRALLERDDVIRAEARPL